MMTSYVGTFQKLQFPLKGASDGWLHMSPRYCCLRMEYSLTLVVLGRLEPGKPLPVVCVERWNKAGITVAAYHH